MVLSGNQMMTVNQDSGLPGYYKMRFMLLKTGVFILLLSPFLSYSQSVDNWQLYLNKQQIASAQKDSVQIVQIHKKTDAALKFVLDAGDTAFIRKVIVMDNEHTGIDSRTVTANAGEAVFSTQELYQKSSKKNLTFYIVKIPANPAKASLVRVAPIPICHLQWVE
jgi:hypothetical protein